MRLFNYSHVFRSLQVTLLLLGYLASLWPQNPTSHTDFDLVIENGRIVDGTGSPWYSGDIGIREGKIVSIGKLSRAARSRTINAHGLIVAPGFIDMLGQSELSILVDPRAPSKTYQGITTEITGEGSSVAPLNDEIIREDSAIYEHYHITPDWRTLRQYFDRLQRQGLGINLATYAGATQVRRFVVGENDRDPTAQELAQMKDLVRQAMLDGAVGLSTALQYAPAMYAKTDELVALAKEASDMGGVYATHLRSESDHISEAIDEAIRIGREAKIPVEIWHIKAAGKNNWGRMSQIVAKVNLARQEGVDIAADTYAYLAGMNSLSAFIPPWAHEGGDEKLIERLKDPVVRAQIRAQMLSTHGDWENEWQEIRSPDDVLIGVVRNPLLMPVSGKRLSDIAKMWNEDPINALFDLLVKDDAHTHAAVFMMSEPDVILALQQPWVSVGTDYEGTQPDGILGKEHPHPRAYGTFPHILNRYVRQEHILTLEEAIRKFTSLPAQRMRLPDRGLVKPGMWADLVIFDPISVTDAATFQDPTQFSRGMEFVLVNGISVIDEGKMTNETPGKIIRGPAYTP